MKHRASGFTIVELIVVIIVIAILASITIIGYNSLQQSSRDTERSAKISVIQEALEKYYTANGEYPGCAAMTTSNLTTLTTTTLVGVDPTAFTAPLATNGTNSITGCTALSGATGSDVFAYVGDGTSTCSTGAACIHYTLQYRQESPAAIISVASRH